jgi:calcium-dependent protein kinase
MYLILSGCSPFAGSSDLQILKQIKDGKYVFEPADTWATVSTSAKEILREMLNVDAAERQSAEKLLEHPWILQEAAAAPGAGQSGMHKQIMSTLHSFTAMQRLKRFSVQIFERHLNEDAENSLTAAFLELDTDRHGLLQIDHVEAVVLHSRCPHETKLQLRHVLYSTAGGCDKVDYNGMIAAMRRSKEQLQTKALRSAFDVLVVESDGMATVKGLMAMLPREVPLKPGVSMQLQDVLGLKTVDIDRIALQLKLTGSDPVKCDEFIGMWRAVPELASAESA